jgi:protein ImuB
LLFHRVDGVVASIGSAPPSSSIPSPCPVAHRQAGTVDPGFGVEHMALTASLAEPLDDRQSVSHGILERKPTSPASSTRSPIVSARTACSGGPVESDVPERSVHRVPALAPAKGESWPANLPRPARLLVPPEPIETMALLPDYPPVQFVWRHVRRRIARADGPERIFGEWWRNDAEANAVRDYFQVEDEAGERFWLFRCGDGDDPQTGTMRWYLHGIFA